MSTPKKRPDQKKDADPKVAAATSTISFHTESRQGHVRQVDLEFYAGKLSRLAMRADVSGWVAIDYQEILQILAMIVRSDAHGTMTEEDLAGVAIVAGRVEHYAKKDATT